MKPTYYHVTPDQSRYLEYVPHQLNILVSAYRLNQFKHISRHLNLARSLMIDSGMISAMKKGEIGWLNNHDLVVEWTQQLIPDYVVALDCPSEPELLKKIGLNVLQARVKTIRNAELMLNENFLPDKTKKVYVLQGWNLDDYTACHEEFKRIGVYEDSPYSMIGIGSVCMRRPKWKRLNKDKTPVPDLYQVAEHIALLMNDVYPSPRVHCFGIGSIEWVQQLYKIGVDSFDSATSSWNIARNDGICQIKPLKIWKCFSSSDKDKRVAYDIVCDLTGVKLRDFEELTVSGKIIGMRSGCKILNQPDERYTIRFRPAKDKPNLNEITVSLNERIGRELDLQFALEMTAYEKKMIEQIS